MFGTVSGFHAFQCDLAKWIIRQSAVVNGRRWQGTGMPEITYQGLWPGGRGRSSQARQRFSSVLGTVSGLHAFQCDFAKWLIRQSMV